MKAFPVEFGIGIRGPKCLNDGPTRWSKKFSDRFSRFDTIPVVTVRQPASHVAVAIRLYAKASSLKTIEMPTINKLNIINHLIRVAMYEADFLPAEVSACSDDFEDICSEQ